MKKSIIVRYGELALKGEPIRRRFEDTLVGNIRSTLRGLEYELSRERGRLFVDTGSKTAPQRLTRVPGIVSVSPAVKCRARIDEIVALAVKRAKLILRSGEAFAVQTTRIGEHEFSSADVNHEVGSAILKAMPGSRVDLSAPDHEIFVEIRGDESHVFTEVLEGVGGLPLGTQGKVLVLFSGTLNSALASYLMMKRGSKIYPLYLEPSPHWGKRAGGRAAAMVERLSCFDPRLRLVEVSYGETFGRILERAPERMRCVICKRSMLRIARAVSRRAKAEAIASGEDSNRVKGLAANLRTIDQSCPLPVLRPLAGMSGSEIKRFASQAGISGPPSPCPYRFRQGRWDPDEVQRVERELGIEKPEVAKRFEKAKT